MQLAANLTPVEFGSSEAHAEPVSNVEIAASKLTLQVSHGSPCVCMLVASLINKSPSALSQTAAQSQVPCQHSFRTTPALEAHKLPAAK